MLTESTFRFSCPTCQKRLKAPLGMAGKKGKCKVCGAVFKIPSARFTHVELPAIELEPVPPPPVPEGPPPVIRVIEFSGRASIKAVAAAMSNHETIALLTTDRLFDPLGHDVHSANAWIEAAGGGMLMVLGADLVLAAFTSKVPASKLGLYVSGGSILALTGGLILQTILLLRSTYGATRTVDGDTGKFRWLLKPNAG